MLDGQIVACADISIIHAMFWRRNIYIRALHRLSFLRSADEFERVFSGKAQTSEPTLVSGPDV